MSIMQTLTKDIKDLGKPAELPVEGPKLFRRKALLVEAIPQQNGTWKVLEAGREVIVERDNFSLLYEAVEVEAGSFLVDAGLPDMEPGQTVEREGRKMVRVTVIAGSGHTAYWHQAQPHGQSCGFKVVADMVTDPLASHFAGKFVDPFEGKPGTRTWVFVPQR